MSPLMSLNRLPPHAPGGSIGGGSGRGAWARGPIQREGGAEEQCADAPQQQVRLLAEDHLIWACGDGRCLRPTYQVLQRGA